MTQALTDLLANALRRTVDMASFAIVFTQPDCQWCDKVKTLLSDHGYVTESIDINTLDPETKAAFTARFNTVPQVVINGEQIGGYAETETRLNTVWC